MVRFVPFRTISQYTAYQPRYSLRPSAVRFLVTQQEVHGKFMQKVCMNSSKKSLKNQTGTVANAIIEGDSG